MTLVARDPVMLFRFALREGDLGLAAGLAKLLRGKNVSKRLDRELARSPTRAPSVAALRALARVTYALGLDRDQG